MFMVRFLLRFALILFYAPFQIRYNFGLVTWKHNQITKCFSVMLKGSLLE